MVSGNKKERVWNDPPIPGDPVPNAGATVCNVSPEVHRLIRSLIYQSDVRRMSYGMVVAGTYILLYWGLTAIDPAVTSDVIIGFFCLGMAILGISNLAYLYLKYR